jgi:hypothetical protein
VAGWFRQSQHLIVVMFQTKDQYSVVVGRPILAAAAFLRGASRLKSRLQPVLAAPLGQKNQAIAEKRRKLSDIVATTASEV